MTGVELLHERSLSPYYFFIVVIVIRYETTAAARWALLFIVRTFFNYTFAVALWTSFHVARLIVTLLRFTQCERATRRSGQIFMPSSFRWSSISDPTRRGRRQDSP